MRSLYLLFTFSLFFSTSNAQFYDWLATNQYSTGESILRDGCTDFASNAYVAGQFNNTLVIGSDTLQAATTQSYLAKYNSSGLPAWAIQIGGNSTNVANAITADQQNNIYIAGFFTGTIQLGSLSVSGSNNSSFYIAKVNSSGTPVWLKANTGNGQCEIKSIALDGSGDVYVTGKYSSAISIGAINLPNSSFDNVFLAKYSSAGVPVWAKTFPCNLPSGPIQMDISSTDKIYLCGTYSDSIMIDTINLNQMAGDVSFICSFNTTGAVLWARSLYVPAPFNEIKNLKCGVNNEIVISGTFQDSIALGLTPVVAQQQNTADVFIAKLFLNGNVNWVAKGEGLGDDVSFGIGIDSSGNIYSTGFFEQDLQFGPLNITTSSLLNDETYMVKLSPAGDPIWGINSCQGGFNYGFDIEIDNLGKTYLFGRFEDSLCLSSESITTNPISNGEQYYIARSIINTNQLSGTVYHDLNNDGIQNIGEPGIPGQVVTASPGPIYAVSNSNGDYFVYLDSGNYDITMSYAPSFHTLSIDSHNITFNGTNLANAGNDFPAVPIPGTSDIKITQHGFHLARVINGVNMYSVTIENKTTIPIDTIEITAILDNGLTLASSPTPIHSQNGQTITWQLTSLPALSTGQIFYTATVDNNVALGTILKTSYSAVPFDTVPTDNYDTLCQTVVLSYDPNDKQVSREVITPEEVTAGHWLNYQIRFQNTGTDTARDVIIRDTLSSMVDLASLRVTASSHDYELKLNREQNNAAAFEFRNIYLPDSNVNQEESNGFITYRVRANTDLVLGDKILNTASIYFDFNDPIVTNTTETVVDTINFVVSIRKEEVDILLYPNPNKGQFNLQLDSPAADQLEILLIGTSGEVVRKKHVRIAKGLQTVPISWEGVSNGLYFVVLQSQDGKSASKRLLIQR